MMKLNAIIERIIKSQYNSIEELIDNSASYSIDEIHILIEHIIKEWNSNKITLVAMYALFKFVYNYLNQSKIQINFKNRIPIPICYFSSFSPLSGMYLCSYLKTLSFPVKTFSLDETDKHLREYLETEKPSLIIFTLTQFIHLEALKKLVPYFHNRNLKVFIGGIPFRYDENLKKEFPNCNFPLNMEDLSLSLTQLVKEGKI